MNPVIRMTIGMELRQAVLQTRALHFMPLAIGGILLCVWQFTASPLLPVVIVVTATLEPQCANILFRSPREFEALCMTPVDWRAIVRAKNLATLLLIPGVTVVAGAVILYFSPVAVHLADWARMVLYWWTVVFPLLHLGNMRSLEVPRRQTGWRTDDLAGAIIALINLSVLSVPFWLFSQLPGEAVLSLCYGAAMGIVWIRYSVPHTASRISSMTPLLCQTA